MDEPLFLRIAQQIASNPLRPLDFEYNAYARLAPAAQTVTNPLLGPYLVAPLLPRTGSDAGLRAALLVYDVLCGVAVYLLAALATARPLWPALAILACPAYYLNITQLVPEKWMLLFGALSLAALGSGRFWASSALMGLALISKYSAAAFLAPAAVLLLQRKEPWRRVALWTAAASAPLAVHLAAYAAAYPEVLGAATGLTERGLPSGWRDWAHKIRSILAFTGGGGAASVAVLGLALLTRRDAKAALGMAAAVAALFLPALDLEPAALLDRLTGAALALGAATAWYAGARGGGWLAAWLAAMLGLQFLLYWNVAARQMLFLIIPTVLLLARRLDRPRLWAASALAGLGLSLALGRVDLAYARAQRDLGSYVAASSGGKTVWFTGHWGFQHYLELAGARALDAAQGGWRRVGRGDLVAVPLINTNILRPTREVPSRVTLFEPIQSRIPLRLMSGWGRHGGFYSNLWGFLPFHLGREPLDRFYLAERL